jgi:cytochrome b pre-mRNA-processing protein 3
MLSFRRLRDRRRREHSAHGLYTAVIEQARLPAFYLRFGVPDTLDGRFDMLVLHAVLVMRRLKRGGEAIAAAEAQALSQALFDLMFADMDQNLRELGVGDVSVGKKVKQMATAFYGRAAAYEDGLAAASTPLLEEALARNLYGTVQPQPAQLAAMAAYVMRQAAVVGAQDAGALMQGSVTFAPPEEPGPGVVT